jgi:hypothetical protein
VRLKGLLASIAIALSLAAAPAAAQTSSTRATLQTQNNNTIAPNGIGAITGSVMNAMLGNMIASEATLLDFNSFSNPPVFSSSGLLFSSAGNPLLFLACTGYVQANGASPPTCLNGISLPLAPGGTAISPSTNGGILYDNAGVLGDSTTLPVGLTVPSPTFTGAVTATGLITASDLAPQVANSVLVNATGSSASPTAQTISGCSAASDALIWTTNVGYGCNTAIAASSMPIGGLTGVGAGVAASLGAATNASGGIVSPTPGAPGDIIYWTGSLWAKFAGNSSGTQVFEENASGAPAWASPTSGGTVTSVTCGTGLSGGTITTTGTCAVSAPIAASLGGSGVASPTAHTVLVGEGVSPFNGVSQGTSGQALVGNGPSADPSFKSGVPVLLNTLNASNSATLSDTTSLTSAYNEYELVFENIVPATVNTSLQFEVHSGGSFQATSYLTDTGWFASAISNASNTTALILSRQATVQNSAPGVSGKLTIFTPSNTTAPKSMNGHFTYFDGTIVNVVLCGGYWNGGNGAVDGFEVLMSSGNITSGTIKVYGVL